MAKYIMTVTFETNEAQQVVENNFQNAVCAFEATTRIHVATLKKTIGDAASLTLDTLQTLRPEDFPSWNREEQRSNPVEEPREIVTRAITKLTAQWISDRKVVVRQRRGDVVLDIANVVLEPKGWRVFPLTSTRQPSRKFWAYPSDAINSYYGKHLQIAAATK